MLTTEVEEINKQLASKYGTDLTNRPNYRVVWSEDMTEKRFSTLETDRPAVIELPKYSYARERFVLEKLMPENNRPPDNEVPVWDGYEPIYIFEDSKNQYLPPLFDVCVTYIYFIQNPVKKTKYDFEQDEIKRTLMRRNKYFDMIDDSRPYLVGMLHDKEAVTVPSNYNKDNK